MIERALEQPGHGGKAYVRVRADIYAFARRHDGGSEMIEEDEGPDIAAGVERQQAAHGKTAYVALTRLYDQVDSHATLFTQLRLQVSMDEPAGNGKLRA
jgi:hypothetical protein